MSKEKKPVSRRSFLKGAAAAGILTAVPGGGLFIQEAEAAKPVYKRRGIKEPKDVKEDKDAKPFAEALARSSLEAAYDAFNAASEAAVKGKANKFNTKSLLAQQGLKLRSSEAKATEKNFDVPASVVKVRKLQLKQKGWHYHVVTNLNYYVYGDLCGSWHQNVTW